MAVLGIHTVTTKLHDEQWYEFIVEIFRDELSSLFQRYISELEDRTTDIIALLQIVALSLSECK